MMAECILDKSGISVSSHKNLSIEVEGGYDKIMNHLILCDPKAFATPDTLVKHMKELEAKVEIYVRNSLQYCEMIKDKPGLFIETRRKRSKVRLVTKQYLDHANIILRQLLSAQEIDGGSLVDTDSAPSTNEVTHVTNQCVEHTDIVLSSHETNGVSLIDNNDSVCNDFEESPTNLSDILSSVPTSLCVPVSNNLESISREATAALQTVVLPLRSNLVDNNQIDVVNNNEAFAPKERAPMSIIHPVHVTSDLDLSSIECSTQVALAIKSSALILKGIIDPSPSFVPQKIDPCPHVTQETAKTAATNFHTSVNLQSVLCSSPPVPLPLKWAIHGTKYENGYEASLAPAPAVIYPPYESSPAPVPVVKYSPYEDPVKLEQESRCPSVSLNFLPFHKQSVPEKGRRRMIKWYLPHKAVKWKMEITYSKVYLFFIIIMSRFIIIY